MSFESIFSQLSQLMMLYADRLVLNENTRDNINIFTHHIMDNKKPLYFGGVKINKKYVSYHLMPVYVFPDLLESITPELKKRMQGKSCFNFSKDDPVLFSELKELTQQGYERYQAAGYL